MTVDKKKKPQSKNPEVKKLQAELEESNTARLRLAADYANLERRISEERLKLREAGTTDLLEKLFPIMDNLYRASTHAPSINLNDVSKLSEDELKKISNYFNGLRLIEQQLEKTLSEAGLERIPTQGEPFNHNLHEAISYEQSSIVPAEHVIDEVESGWQINGKVIRPAKVRVSQG